MKLRTILLVLTSLLSVSFPWPGFAGVHQCTDANGQIVFQDRPCVRPVDLSLHDGATHPAVNQNNRHFLWKATSKVNTIHLFGSIHFGSTEMYPLPEAASQAYESSDALIVEVNLNEADPRATALTLMQSGSYPEGETVQADLSPEIWEKLTKVAKKQRLDLLKLQSQKPWLISLTLNTLAIQKSGFSPEFGIDRYFINGAEGKKPILELETAQQQMVLLSTFPTVEQNRLLKETLDQLDQATSYFRSMLEAWQTGDTARLRDLTQSEIASDPDARKLYDVFFARRNHAMTDKIVEFSRSGENYFIVVGAGHLVGEQGIIELLRGRGYELTQL